MADLETLEKVREFFKNDRYATETGAVIDEIGDHYAKVSLTINDHHKNAMGGVMGGVYFTLADFAFAVASNWQEPGVVGLGGEFHLVALEEFYTHVRDARLATVYDLHGN